MTSKNLIAGSNPFLVELSMISDKTQMTSQPRGRKIELKRKRKIELKRKRKIELKKKRKIKNKRNLLYMNR